MTDFIFSKRIETIAGYIHNKSTVADIGTDHGYLPLYLLTNNFDVDIIAADLRESPLEKAVRNLSEAGFADRVSFCISDGLDSLGKKADTYIICGMGGYVIMHILERALEGGRVFEGAEFVLSPHSDEKVLRKFLYKNGFRIEDEKVLKERDFFYTVIYCIYDGKRRQESEVVYSYGRQPLYEKQPDLQEYLLREKRILTEVSDKLKDAATENAKDKLNEINDRLRINEEAFEIIK